MCYYSQLQQLVVSGELPCSKEEAAILAGIQLRIEETWPQSKNKVLTTTTTSQTSQQTSLRQNINTGEKLRPICEDVKVCSYYSMFSNQYHKSTEYLVFHF